MNKELKIIPPEGYEIDKENSTFECIKFKPKTKKWRYNAASLINGFYLTSASGIREVYGVHNDADNCNVFATEKQAKSALAMAQLSQIIANDERFGGPITDEEWRDTKISKFCIVREGYEIHTNVYYYLYHFLAFHTAKQRDLFVEENEDLIENYFML